MDSKTKKWLSKRARPLEKKTVTYPTHIKWKNYGLPEKGEVTLIAGKCPCSICGHEWMWQCEEEDCKCCSSTCT